MAVPLLLNEEYNKLLILHVYECVLNLKDFEHKLSMCSGFQRMDTVVLLQ
jgi:hypothetical protein